MCYKTNGRDIMDKWIGWVTDSEGFVIHFVSPTSQAWAKRKTHQVFTDNHGECWWSNLGYALRTSLNGCTIENQKFSKLSAGHKEELNKLLVMGLDVSPWVAI